jgi:hypothetical protein
LTDTRPVTYRELRDSYNEMKDEYFARDARITFRLIDIQPDKLQAPAPIQDRGQFAEELANKLLERIRAGEDFAELAKQHSHGHRKAFGGLWQPVQPESLAAPYNVIAAEADKIEPGQIAGPIVVAGRVFIMKLEEKQTAGYARFEDADVCSGWWSEKCCWIARTALRGGSRLSSGKRPGLARRTSSSISAWRRFIL